MKWRSILQITQTNISYIQAIIQMTQYWLVNIISSTDMTLLLGFSLSVHTVQPDQIPMTPWLIKIYYNCENNLLSLTYNTRTKLGVERRKEINIKLWSKYMMLSSGRKKSLILSLSSVSEKKIQHFAIFFFFSPLISDLYLKLFCECVIIF